jgi:hypothetical protein
VRLQGGRFHPPSIIALVVGVIRVGALLPEVTLSRVFLQVRVRVVAPAVAPDPVVVAGAAIVITGTTLAQVIGVLL